MVGATVLLSVDAGVPKKGVPDEGVPDTVLLDVEGTAPVAFGTVKEGVNLLVTEVAVIELAVIVELGFVVATVALATVVELVCDGVGLGVSTGADLGVDASLMRGGVTNGCPGSTMGPWVSAGS